ncbi:MAG: MurT ligase domain-containing protein, partial [Eubacteriales bacterium]
RLASENVRKVYIAGKYVWDIAQRLSYSEIPAEKLEIIGDLDGIGDMLSREKNDLYIVTCFSDRDKFISRLPADAAERKEL